MNIALSLILGIITSVTGWLGYMQMTDQEISVGGFSDPFISLQLAASPSNGYILSTDGTNNSWIANTGGSSGGGSGLWSYDSAGNFVYLPNSPTTTSTTTAKATAFTATSTSVASTFPQASSTNLTVSGNLWADLTGNADTATALAANGANCSAGNSPLGVDASGAVESCFDVWTEAENTSAAYTPQSRTLTVAGTSLDITSSAAAQDLSANRTWTLNLDRTATLAGNPAYAASTAGLSANGIIFEGSTADTLEGLLTTSDITSTDKTWTLPNTTGTIALLTSAMTGTYDGNNFGGGAIGQGDLLYGSAAGTIAELAKDTNSTRYLSNQGTSNNPSWNQVNLANGVTGNLPYSNMTLTNSIIEPDLSADNSPNDGDVLTYDTTGTNFVWETILALINTITGAVDWGAITSLEIPNGSNPTVNATGEIAIKTATSTVEFYDGTNQQTLSPYFDLSFQFASTTLDTGLNSFDTGTTTWYLRNADGKIELESQYCKTNAGTLSVNVGDGTNWADQLIANSSGAEDETISSNSTFNDREDIQVRIGSGATSPNRIQCTLTFRRTP